MQTSLQTTGVVSNLILLPQDDYDDVWEGEDEKQYKEETHNFVHKEVLPTDPPRKNSVLRTLRKRHEETQGKSTEMLVDSTHLPSLNRPREGARVVKISKSARLTVVG